MLFPTVLYAKDANIEAEAFRSDVVFQPIFFLIMVGLVILISLLFLLDRQRKNRVLKRGLEKYSKNKISDAVQDMHVSVEAEQVIHELAERTSFRLDKLYANSTYFEKAVLKICKLDPKSPIITKLQGLREELGFIFFNRRVDFITSKMLQTGQKIRVSLNFKGKVHSYVSTILSATETDFWVKPPTVKGKVANLSKFRALQFKVNRHNDGDYRFVSPLISQIKQPTDALVMGHSFKIEKMKQRAYERYQLQFERSFDFLFRSGGGQDAREPFYSLTCDGTVQDISLGGLKFSTNKVPEETAVGTRVMFKLKEANIKKEIQAKIVRLSTQKEDIFVHLQFVEISELNSLYLQKFIAAKNPVKVKEL